MVRVYCDTGGFRPELKNFERGGKLSLVMFPYENKNRNIKEIGLPSRPTFADLENLTWESLPGTFADYEGSEMLTEIERVIGRNNRRDVLHVDSAFRSKCACFLSSDKGDILSRRAELEKLLEMKFFHCIDEWNNFLKFVDCNTHE